MIPSFSSKDPREVVVVSMDFTAVLELGETISGCTFTAIDRQRKVDASTQMIEGVADTAAAPVVKQRVKAGVDGHNYLIRAEAALSSGRVLVGAATLPVREGAA